MKASIGSSSSYKRNKIKDGDWWEYFITSCLAPHFKLIFQLFFKVFSLLKKLNL